MEEMIESCIPHCKGGNDDVFSESQALGKVRIGAIK